MFEKFKFKLPNVCKKLFTVLFSCVGLDTMVGRRREGIKTIQALVVIIVVLVAALIGTIAYYTTLPPPPPIGPATITGKVVDEKTGSPLAGAVVTLNGLKYVTGPDGTFSFSVKLGKYTVTVSVPGYETKTVSVEAKEEKTYTLDIRVSLIPPKPLGKELIISQKADMSTLDVQHATDAPTLAILGHVYETLFKAEFDEKGRATFKRHLAESYEIINSTAWKFKLRAGVKFHDGTPLTSHDVKATIDRGRNFPLPRLLFGFVKSVEIIDDLTFILHLSYPFGAVIAHLAHPSTAIIPKWVAEKLGPEPIKDIKYIIGTGPFKFSEFIKLERTVLVRNEEYWGPKATIEKIIWRPIEDDDARVIALETGAVDIATHIPPHMISVLKQKNFDVVKMPSTRVIFFVIQCERIKDVRVRQALNYAIDKEAIVKKILEGAGTVATAPIPPAVFGYTKLDPYPYDPAKARALLEQAGFIGKEITMIVPAGRYLKDREVAVAVADYLFKVGLKVKTIIYEWAAYLPKTIEGDFDLALLGWSTVTLDADYGLYALFHSANFPPGFNRARYSNSRVDELLYKGRISPDALERLKAYEEAQKIIWEEAPWIFLHYEDIIVAMRRGLVIEIQPIERWILTYATVRT